MKNNPVDAWVLARKLAVLDSLLELLAEDFVFTSAIDDKNLTDTTEVRIHLSILLKLLSSDSFQYVRKIIGPHDAMLEFTSDSEGLPINGVEIIHWNDDGKVTELRLMVRPIEVVNEALNRLKERLYAANKAQQAVKPRAL